MPPESCILFEHFVKLLNSISQVRPRRTDSSCNANTTPRSLELVDRWFTEVRRHYPSPLAHTCKIFFRLLFPEEDVRRRYNLKETTLARSLATDVFCLSTRTHGAGRILIEWSEYPETSDKAKLGCLGAEIEKVLSDRHSIRQGQSLSIQRVDELLDELASLSGYSNLCIPVPRQKRARAAILRDLFLDLEPMEAKFLTQIILKDLRPVLYPLSETHTTRALLHYKSNAIHVLTKWEVMRIWNPSMPRIYRAKSTLDEAANAVETLPSTNRIPPDHAAFSPVLGVPIEIPKSQKGLKLSHALSYFRQEDEVWAETKYDGERMQIHVELTLPASRQITIFSKSKRNSTLDRIGTHPFIRAALNLPPSEKDYSQYPELKGHAHKASIFPTPTSVILDAEMVCYSESKGEIDEFWRLRSLIEKTAYGVRGSRHRDDINRTSNIQESQDSGFEESPEMIMESLQSNGSDDGDRHLKLVFFDVLSLNGSSLLDKPYDTRRGLLERLVNKIPGYVSLSFRQPINMSHGLPAAVKVLAKIFSEHIANHQEGLVLKASKSHYNDHRLPWVKLKRDYIPGYGDTVDLVVLGAGWNKDRARQLRVSPETFTTFFVAGLENPKPSTDKTNCTTPRFQVLFSVEYGMDREQLETFNMYIKTSETHPYRDHIPGLPYTFKLPQLQIKPTLIFSRPLLAELFGAGFTKDVGSGYYSLRFPRITKVWWTNERDWAEGTHLEEFQRIARLSIGRESGEEWANRSVEAMWGCDAHPEPKDPKKIAETSMEWHQKLLNSETSVVGTTSKVSNATCARNPKLLSKRRKEPPVSIPESSAKRQKLQSGRSPHQPLRALGSMTNVMRVDAGVRGQIRPDTMHQLLQTSTEMPTNHPRGKQASRGLGEDKRILQVAIEDVPIPSITMKQPDESQKTPLPLLSTSRPRYSSGTSPLLESMNDVEVFPTEQPATSGHPITPKTSQHVPSSSQISPSIEEHDLPTSPRPYWPQKFIHTPIVQFLQDSYVWIPRESENRRQIDRPRALDLIPQNRRTGIIYYLLIICGCRVSGLQRTAEQFAHVDKCIMFVKTGRDPEIQEGLNWLFNNLESRRAELNNPGNKELFVFDSNMITYDSLATFRGEVEPQALWRSSRYLANTSKILF